MLFRFDGKALSISDKRVMYDAHKNVIATMKQKVGMLWGLKLHISKFKTIQSLVKHAELSAAAGRGHLV